jgi:aspartyl/asparaginyl-tRNA synthetase
MMELVQSMVCHVAQKVLGKLKPISSPQNCNEAWSALDNAASFFEPPVPSDEIEEQQKEFIEDANLVALHNDLLSLRKRLPEIGPATATKQALQLISGAKSKGVKGTTPDDLILEALQRCVRFQEIDLTPPWRRIKYKDIVRERAGTDWFEISPQARRERAVKLGAEIGKEYEDFEVTQAVFEKLIEPTLINPTFVTHAPKELIPLAKLSPEDPTTVEVFECCINGQEIAPAYTEQNDPLEQRERLEHQAGGEQQKLDEDFLVALEHGMPPAGGMGMGIDRLCMMLLGQESIRDVILFPQLKPTARVG